MGTDTRMKPVWSLHYCLICVTENGNPCLNEDAQAFVKDCVRELLEKKELVCRNVETSECHMKVVFDGTPSTDLVKLINALKTATSRKLKKVIPSETERIWERSYYLATMDMVTEDVVEHYIQERKNFKRRRYRVFESN